jgi:hypothetical protein
MEKIYESATETAKKVKKELKKYFPGVKFSVTSEKYSMGSRVIIFWTDGPIQEDVQLVAACFQSCSFDGMDDSTAYHGYEYEGKLYRGADYVRCSRIISPEYRWQIEAIAVKMFEGFNNNSNYYRRQFREAERTINPMPESLKPLIIFETVAGTVIETVPQTVKVTDTETDIEADSATSKVVKFTPKNPVNPHSDEDFLLNLFEELGLIEKSPIKHKEAPVVSLEDFKRRRVEAKASTI